MSTIPNFPVDTANMGSITRTRFAFKPTDTVKTGATTAAADVVSLAGHPFQNGDYVEFAEGTNFTGLTAGKIYVARDVVITNGAGVSFKLAEMPAVGAEVGAAVPIASGASAGTFSLVIGYETAKVDDEGQAPGEDSVEMPDDLGNYYPVLTSYGSTKDSYGLVTHEILRLRKLFRGALQGVRLGQAKLWMPSAQMAQAGNTNPFLESEWFPAAVTRGQNITFGDKKASVTTIRITSQKRGPVLFPEAV